MPDPQDPKDPGVKPEGDPPTEPKPKDPLSGLSSEARKIFEETQSGLLSALEKERDANKEATKRMAALEKAAQDAEKKRLQDKEDYKSLYEKAEGRLAELEPQAEKLTVYETVMQESYQAALADIPENKRSLIPEELPVEKKLKYIATNRALLSKSSPLDQGAGNRGGGGETKVELTPEQKQAADKMGVKHEDYAKQLEK